MSSEKKDCNLANPTSPTASIQWIDVSIQLPPIPEDEQLYKKQVKVIGCWGERWAEFYYVKRVVRGKVIDRFEWNGRINTFPITHWMIPTLPKLTDLSIAQKELPNR